MLANAETLTADFRKALKVYPRHPAAAVWMAQVLGLAAKVQPPLEPERPVGSWRKPCATTRSDLAVAEALARLALQRGDQDEAHKYLEQVRALAPYSRLAATETP